MLYRNTNKKMVTRDPQILSGKPIREIFEKEMVANQRVKALWESGL